MRETLSVQQLVTATFKQRDGGDLNIRKETVAKKNLEEELRKAEYFKKKTAINMRDYCYIYALPTIPPEANVRLRLL